MSTASNGALALRHREDRATVVLLAAHSLAMAGGYALVVATEPVPWPMLLAPALGVLAFVGNVVKHNHMHCATFAHRRANLAMNLWLSVLTGTSCTGIIGPHHQRHHGASQSDDDFVRASLLRFRHNALNLLLFPLVSTIDMARRKPSELFAWRRRRRRLWRLVVAERACILAVLAAALLLSPRAGMLALVLPWLIGQALLLSINLLQHQHLEPHDPRHAARDVVGRATNLLLFNAGFHSAHHLVPGAHWSTLPALHAARIAGPDRAALEHDSLLDLVVDRLRARGDAAPPVVASATSSATS